MGTRTQLALVRVLILVQYSSVSSLDIYASRYSTVLLDCWYNKPAVYNKMLLLALPMYPVVGEMPLPSSAHLLAAMLRCSSHVLM